MANNVKWPLKIEANTFQEFREQFNENLKNLFRVMVEDKVEQAALKCSFDIKLVSHDVEDPDTGDMATILSPIVKHKIAVTIQNKTEATGGFGSPNYQMIWNKRTEQYEIVPITVSQRSMFEDGYDYEEGEADG